MSKIINLLKVMQVFSITGRYLLLSKKSGSDVVTLKHDWSRDILKHFKIELEIKGTPALLDTSCILLGNHISYLDIPLIIKSCPDVIFVSKNEVRYWPVIGAAAVKMETIFVQRKNNDSRSAAKEKISESLGLENKRVVIFPSGTTSIKPSVRWQRGIFEVAQQNNIRIQPFRLTYEPLRESAYIDDDNLLISMFNLFKLKKIKAVLEFHLPTNVNVSDCENWKSWCEGSSH